MCRPGSGVAGTAISVPLRVIAAGASVQEAGVQADRPTAEPVGTRFASESHVAGRGVTYTVYSTAMPRTAAATEVLTIRVSRELAQRLAAEARRQRRTRSAVARAALAQGLGQPGDDLAAEARRQSLLVRRRTSEREAIRFAVGAADLKGWE